MKKSLIVASLLAITALAACSKKEEVVAPAAVEAPKPVESTSTQTAAPSTPAVSASDAASTPAPTSADTAPASASK